MDSIFRSHSFHSNCVACLYFFILLFAKRKSTYVCLNPSMFRPEKTIVAGICGVGIPASIQNLLNVTGMTVLNNFTSSYGPEAVAAMGISQKLAMIPMYIALGLSQGLMPLISYNYAAGNIPRMKKALLFAERTAISFMVTMAILYFLLLYGLAYAQLTVELALAAAAVFVLIRIFHRLEKQAGGNITPGN